MPRLLLVDDNPSIHKIAETLLASTDVELVCAESGSAALELIATGPAFDVALVDLSMAVMDGWQLVERMRNLEATARLPIALMAGVLDQVDPDRLSHAPVQGFIKKPVELRDLGEQVKKLLATPVEAPAVAPSLAPGATMPAVRLSDYPEFRQAILAASAPDDLILLGPEDLFPGDFQVEEEAGETLEEEVPVGEEVPFTEEVLFADEPAPPEPPPVLPAPPEDVVVLEEFDLDSLRDLTPPALAALPDEEEDELGDLTPPMGYILPVPPDEGSVTRDGIEFLGEFPGHMGTGRLPREAEPPEDFLVSGQHLPDLGAEAVPPAPGTAAPLSEVSAFDWSDDSDSLVLPPEAPAAPEPEPIDSQDFEPVFEMAEPEQELERAIDLAVDGFLPQESHAVITTRVPPLPEEEVLPSSSASAQDLAAAILADPVLLDRLAVAIAGRLSERTLREVAWEVMPEIADRLKRL